MYDADRPLRRVEVAARIQELRRRQAEQQLPTADPAPAGAAGPTTRPETTPSETTQPETTQPDVEVPADPASADGAQSTAERIARMLRDGSPPG
jgi:hypothetical protein